MGRPRGLYCMGLLVGVGYTPAFSPLFGIGLHPSKRTPSGIVTPGVGWSWGSYMVLWVAVFLTVRGVLPLQLVVLWAAVSGSRGSSLSAGLLEGWAPACGGSGLGDLDDTCPCVSPMWITPLLMHLTSFRAITHRALTIARLGWRCWLKGGVFVGKRACGTGMWRCLPFPLPHLLLSSNFNESPILSHLVGVHTARVFIAHSVF